MALTKETLTLLLVVEPAPPAGLSMDLRVVELLCTFPRETEDRGWTSGLADLLFEGLINDDDEHCDWVGI